MSRSLLRSALELRSPITRLPPTYLLPLGARWLSSTHTASSPEHASFSPSTTTTTIPPTPAPPAGLPPSLEASRSQQTSADIHAKATATAAAAAAAAAAASPPPPPPSSSAAAGTSSAAPASPAQPLPARTGRQPPLAAPPPPTGPIPERVRALLPLLRAQPGHYITVHVHGRPYLVTPGDLVRLPFRMPGVSPGDVLRLNRASVLGSRDLTLRPARPTNAAAAGPAGPAGPAGAQAGAVKKREVPYIDERLFECRAVVVGVESENMRLKEKTKRRNRKTKTVKSKHRFTVVRISELRIKSPEELDE